MVKAVFCGAVLSAASALACINGMNLEEIDPPNEMIAKSAKAYRDGRFAEAAISAEQGLQEVTKASERRALLRTRGLAYLKLGHYGQARDALDELAKSSREPFVKVKLAEAALRKAATDDRLDSAAKSALEKLAATGLLADADAWTALAQGRLRAGERDAAREACDRALKVQPGHPEATTLLQSLQRAPRDTKS